MIATTRADMTDDEIMIEVREWLASRQSKLMQNDDWIALARALLARQPAAIDREAVAKESFDENLAYADWLAGFKGSPSWHDAWMARAALSAPLDKEASKPAVAVAPCKGMNCGCTDGINHSLECHAEHAAAIAGGTFKPAAPSVEQDEGVRQFEALCDLLPSDVNWGDHLTPDIARHIARAASTSANVAQGAELVHLDDWWVDLFAKEMKGKLGNARAKGRGGWQDCGPADLSRMLREHVKKGDPSDVANFCMFLWALRSPICAAPPAQTALTDDARDAARYRWLKVNYFDWAAPGDGDSFDHIELHFEHELLGRDDSTVDAAIDADMAAAQSASGDTQ